MGIGVVWLDIPPYASLIQRGVELPHANERVTQLVGARKRIQLHCLPLLLQRFVHAIQRAERIRTQVVNFGGIGIQFYGTSGLSLGSHPIPPIKELDRSHREMRLGTRSEERRVG